MSVYHQSKPDQTEWKGHIHTNPGNDCPTTKRREEKYDGGNGKRSTRSGFLKRRTVPASVSPSVYLYSIDSIQERNSLNIYISMLHNQTKEIAEIPALLDSGAGGIFIDQNYT